MDQVRRQEAHRLQRTNPELLKGSRYLWLKNPWRLRPQERQRLEYLERLNLGISRAYLLKEYFRQLWHQPTKEDAGRFLDHWLRSALSSGLAPMRQFASLLATHGDGVLAFFDLPTDNGAVEGMNARAKAISIRARGYRSPTVFSTVRLHCLGSLQTPIFLHKFSSRTTL